MFFGGSVLIDMEMTTFSQSPTIASQAKAKLRSISMLKLLTQCQAVIYQSWIKMEGRRVLKYMITKTAVEITPSQNLHSLHVDDVK